MAVARQFQAASALMGWVALLVIGGLAALLLRLLGIGRGMWWFVGAALTLGAAGYAVQGQPALDGNPVQANAEAIEVDPSLVELRGAMFGRFNADAAFLTASDAYVRNGDLRNGADYILAGIRQNPGSAMLWSGLGTVLAQHDGDTVSPAALFAFRRAVALAPQHPGPVFFLGVADVRAGQFAPARDAWTRALALTPTNASYRAELALRLALLDRVMAETQGGQMLPPAPPPAP